MDSSGRSVWNLFGNDSEESACVINIEGLKKVKAETQLQNNVIVNDDEEGSINR